jgi:hypothetical protein
MSINIVIPSDPQALAEKSLALRLAHSLDIYLRLDCEIRTDAQFLKLEHEAHAQAQSGNIIAIGGFNNSYSCKLLAKRLTEFSLNDERIRFRGNEINCPELGDALIHIHLKPDKVTYTAQVSCSPTLI